MPAHVRRAVDSISGAAVVSATNLDGGFSPGPAARCALADGRTVFVKAAGLELNPHSPGMHRREGQVLGTLGGGAPAPALVGMFDDGDWVALVIEWIEGRMPVAPLDRHDVDRLLHLVERLAVVEASDDLRPCHAAHPGLWGHWRRLLDEPLTGLDGWSQRHLDGLVELEADVADAIGGDRLVHLDLRSDNVIFSAVGADDDVIVDWPGASAGAPWIDLVALAPALELDGGPTPAHLLARHPVGRAADPDAVTVLIASIAGYFTRMSLLPPPVGLPTLRPFQAAQGLIARRWLAQRCGWPPDDIST